MSSECHLCPRDCGVDRDVKVGFCLAPADLLVVRAAPHLWEEPILSGTKGSGTIFFSGCTMACCFCQNRTISRTARGKLVAPSELADVMLKLEQEGCHNINLVTADHYVEKIVEAAALAKTRGLTIPIALNTSSYLKPESVAKLEGLVDIYLADLKYYEDRYAIRYSSAPQYFETASAAIAEMFRQTGSAIVEAGLLQKGLVIRHLALPSLFFDSKKVIRYVHETYGNQVYFSLMNQYMPLYGASRFKEINRPLTSREYEGLLDYCDELGIENGFSQGEAEADKAFYIPAFDGTGLEFLEERSHV